MNSNVRFIPSSKLSKAELPFVLTPDECIDIFSRVRNPNDILKSLPNELSQRISLSAKKSTSGLLKSMEAELVKVDWIAVSNSPRRGALSDAQINRYPKLKTYIQSVIYTGKTKVNKASYQPVTDDVVLPKDYIYVPSDPIPENKIVVEVAGQSPASNAAFYLSKSNDLSAKITQAKPDKKVSHRSLVKFEQLESVPRDLYLHIKMQGHPNPLSLRLAEGIMPVSKETEMAEWDNVLVPVRPLAYLNEEKSKSKSAELKAGYLYIFWKGKLWRELFITDKSYYQDIDVEYFRHLEQQEKNKQNPQPITRYPEGFDQQHVLLPYKIKGELQQGENGLKLLFRPQALTFAQIEKFEQDSAKLDKESTALDDINTYSVEQSFSDKNHILGVSSAQIHEVSEKDMPWLSDNAVVVDSLKDTNIAVAYVDGHNSGLRVELKTLGKYPIPEADFLIQFEDGTSQQERLDEEGFHFFESIPEGEFTITYSDYDDVYVKSVAAHICDAIKHRNKSKTFRLLSQSTEAIPMIVEAYDKYFNNNQGNGLVKDILHLFTRPNIRVAVIGLLVAGGVDVGGGETYYPPEATQNTILAIQAQPALSTVIKDSVLKLKLNRQRAIVESTKAYSEYKWFIAHSQQAIKDEGAPPLAYLGKDIDIEFKPEFYGQHIIMCRHQYH
ncbi:hypothetical protein, partial [Vibrio azureus]